MDKGGYELVSKQQNGHVPTNEVQKDNAEQPPSRTKVLLTVSFHIATASSVTLTNKAALDCVNAPLILLFLQMLISVLCTWSAYYAGFIARPPSLTDKKVVVSLLPLIGVKIVALVSKTYCLAFVTASFYQIVRGLLLPMTVIMSYLFLSSKPTLISLIPIAIVCAGFLVGIRGQFDTSIGAIGVALGVWSSFTTAIDSIIVKKFASELKMPVLDMVYFTSVGIATGLIPMIVFSSEISIWTQPPAADPGASQPRFNAFYINVVLSGIITFLLNIAAFLQIKVTSPTTHMISTAFRGILQSLLAVVLLGDIITADKWLSILVILAGTMGYTWIKEIERRKKSEIAANTQHATA